jgi:hypothetical protein
LLIEPNAVLFLDCHGKDLLNNDGQIGLLVLGLPEKAYIVDVVALSSNIPLLAPFLQNRKLRKVVWDGRLCYAELWHRFSIRLENVLDLQLVYLHGKYDFTQRKCFPLSGKVTAIKDQKLLPQAGVEIEQKSSSLYLLMQDDEVTTSKEIGPLVLCHRHISISQMSKWHIYGF